MRLSMISAMALILLVSFFSSSRAQPATAPTTAPAETMTLDGGKIIFTPPAGLNFLGKRDDDKSASFSVGNNEALISLVVTLQPQAIPDDFPPKLAQLLAKTIREQAAQGQIDIIMHPRAEKDPRLLLRVHDKFNTEERFGDRMQMYRAVGLYLVGVVATAFTEDEAEAKRIHELGADLILSVRINRPSAKKPAQVAPGPATRPVSFANAKIRVTPPARWEADATDNPSGLIVTYRDPREQSSLIMLSVRRLPPEARRDPTIRDILIEELVAGEKASFRMDDAKVSGETSTIADRRFLRKTRTDYTHQDRRIRVTSRQVRAGDAIVSVTMVALEENADAVDAIADKIAVDVKPLR